MTEPRDDEGDWPDPWGPPGRWGPPQGGWGPPGGGRGGRGPGGRRGLGRGPGGWDPGPWGRGPGHGAMRMIGCFFVALIVFIALIAALASWLAGTLLGIVAPGSGAAGSTAFVVIVVIFIAILVVGRVFGSAVRPLARIANAAERLADGDSNVRVAVNGPGPVRRLAASFNAMAERLDRSRADRQALLADVTHELRTPLQVIGGSVEAMIDGVHPLDDAHLAPILAEIAVMNRLLDDLRTVSLAEAGALPLHREDVEIRRLEADVVAGQAAAAEEKGVALTAAGGAAITLAADPVRIREVLANLVVNAIRHTPGGGSVSLDARVDDGSVELTVADTGEGIVPADLERVFDRFHRRADTGGSGLGLTIVRDLVTAHGGTVRAESDGIAGHGTRFTVRLPRRD